MPATVEQMRDALKEIFDPEIPINIVDLGLIYKVEETEPGKVNVEFTVTSPACPVGEELARKIKETIARQDGVKEVNVQIVWEPTWTKEKMSFEGKLQASMLGIA